MKTLIQKLKLEEYIVKDLLKNENEFIFILESPHIEEVKTKCPLAGKSGIAISKTLLDKEKPFGLLIQDKKINLNKFGIINVSQIPLQLEAYQCNIINSTLCNSIRKFETIRKNPNKRQKNTKYYNKEELNKLISKIKEDLKNRIKNINNLKNKKYILCGNFAQIFFIELNLDISEKNIFYAPHPSFNNWKKDKYSDKIKKLKKFIKTTKHRSE